METKDIVQAIANIHNDLCNMLVGADNAVILGRNIENIRALLVALSQDVTAGKEGDDG